MTTIKNVVLIGAGGNLGPSILAPFLKSSFKVTVLSRESSKSTFPPEATVVKTDYSPSSLATAFKDQDAVISIVGNEGFADQTKIIDAAVAAGVKRFIPSEFGSDTANDAVRAIVPIFNGKKQVVDYLRSKESSTFSWTAFITGPFFDWGLEVGFLGYNIANKTATIWDSGDVPFSGTNLSTIGTGLVALLSKDVDASANKYVYISSHTVSQNEILAGLEKITGEKFTVTKQDSKKVIEESHKKLGAGDYSVIPPLILAAAYGPDALGDFTKVDGGLWNERLGLAKEDLDASLKAVVSGKRV
ncbi:hypothetical protein EG327_000023 [Venturia inaequalis]|uniref:NmrA-like domain-containing protein n=1 Tax=Venturia inaequalis TaxID=5025 RepID=A0A8H3ZCS5_VENIN|nr:hypothetical protein EG327_000023 [Venturia inaequalis]